MEIARNVGHFRKSGLTVCSRARRAVTAADGFEFPPRISLDLPGFHQPLAQAFEFFADSLFTRYDVIEIDCRTLGDKIVHGHSVAILSERFVRGVEVALQ
jgi:hypothetical protein